MPRKARIVVPGVVHHVVQRGHNRQVVFAADEDFQFYLENLAELKGELDIRLYAYCLMTNHVHLLLMPAQTASLADKSDWSIFPVVYILNSLKSCAGRFVKMPDTPLSNSCFAVEASLTV